MISGTRVINKDATITAALGTGAVTFEGHYVAGFQVVLICIQTAATNYDIEITDSDGYGLYGKTGLAGNQTISVSIPAREQCTMTLTNATNTTYSVRLYLLHSVS